MLLLLGAVALHEGRRLYTLRETLVAGAVVGDDTFPIVVGLGLLAVGGYILAAGLRPVKVYTPPAEVRARMLIAAGTLVGYWLVVPWVGYTATTAVVAVVLFRTMGGYRWPVAALLAALTTGALYLMFRVWLLQPLPFGVLGF